MIKDYSVYIEHMLDCIHRVNEYVESKEHFYSSRLVQDAVVRNLQIMSESSQRLSGEIKDSYPEIPWRKISGFRNILVHDYLGSMRSSLAARLNILKSPMSVSNVAGLSLFYH